MDREPGFLLVPLFVGLILAVVLQIANTASSMLSTLQSDPRGASQHSSPEQRQP